MIEKNERKGSIVKRPSLIADRDNDNALVAGFDKASGTLTVRAEQRLGAVNIWLRFRLENLTPGEVLRLDVRDLDPVAGVRPLYLSWDEGESWSRTAEAEPPYAIEVTGPSLEVSRNLPYPLRRLQQWQQRFDSRADDSPGRLEVLCRSPGGRDVPIFVSEPAIPGCPLIWAQARSHAFESHSSRVAEALIAWLLSEEGAGLRERAMVCVIPMIDVDAVAAGSAGKNRTPHDPNRDYALEKYPQTRAIKQRLATYTQEHPVAAFLDVHSPWYHNKCQWYVAEEEREHLAIITENFSTMLERIGAENSWHGELLDYKKRGFQPDPQYIGAARWARQQWPEAVVTTMEVAHDCDAHGRSITPEGLVDYARALGMCLELCVDDAAVN